MSRAIALFLIFFSQFLWGDPIAPSLLEVTRQSESELHVLWRTPIKPAQSNKGVLTLALPKNCQQQQRLQAVNGLFVEEGFYLICPVHNNVDIEIEQLISPSANVLARYFNGETLSGSRILTPEHSTFFESEFSSSSEQSAQYLIFGIEHLLQGLDHVLYLICLVFLSGLSRKLLVTVTLFTIAHSITLACAMFEVVRLPVSLIELMIAFSIVYSAGLLINQQHSLNDRKLWLSVFGFGLLHGFGFSSVLSEIGLPADDIPWSLFLFNLGIEVGQLLLITALMIVMWFFKRILRNEMASYFSVYRWVALVVGIVAAHWFWQRLLSV